MNDDLLARAEQERRRRIPAVIESDGQAYHRGEEISREQMEELTAAGGIRAIDFTPPGEDSL
jgi:hypothetical protein